MTAVVWGLFALGLGSWWLLGQLDVVAFEWRWVGPLALIVVGASAVVGWRACRGYVASGRNV